MSKHCRGMMLALCLTMFGWALSSAHADEPAAPAPKQLPFLGGFITESRVLYPLQLQGWEAGKEHRYEIADLGVSVEYNDPADKQRWLTMYFYPAGVLSATQVDQAFDNAIQGIQSVAKDRYTRFEVGKTGTFDIALGDKPDARHVTGRSVPIEVGMDKRDLSSAMALLVTDLYYVKGRLTQAAGTATPAQTQAQLEALMAELARRSEFRSTGACWTPPPVRANAQLNPKAKGVLAVHKFDGRVTALSFEDHVEALDPDGSDARVAQMWLMAASDLLLDGCVAPDWMTPTVPPEQRELRFEYPPPSDSTDGNTPRLRGSRRGIG